jgi:Tol biopolymer transport system component
LGISSVAGGTPIQLTDDTFSEFAGSWSPDGGWFVYTAARPTIALMKVKTTGQAHPIVLKMVKGPPFVPAWSPAGNWISHGDELISPDGKTTRNLGARGSAHYMFSQDGRLVYGLRSEKDVQLLFSIDLTTGAERVIGSIGSDWAPDSHVGPSIRFSLAPDGKSFVYASGRFKTNLWMLEGFAKPKHWFGGLFR